MHEIGAVDGEKDLVLLHGLPDADEGPQDTALIGGENLGQKLLIEIDIADGLLLLRKRCSPTGSILIALS